MQNYKEMYDQALIAVGEFYAAVNELALQEEEKAVAAETAKDAAAARAHKATAAGMKVALEYADDMLPRE